ncbi:MAG: LytTR family DNA-binding domain-containing protein [Bacteroidota bacterium]
METAVIVKKTEEQESVKPVNSALRMGVIKSRSTAFLKLETQKWVKIDFSNVIYIEAREKISVLFFTNGDYMVCKSPLYKVQCILPVGFERIHRAYIVNVKWIDFVDVNKKQVNLKNDVSLALGLSYKECIAKYFVNPNNK